MLPQAQRTQPPGAGGGVPVLGGEQQTTGRAGRVVAHGRTPGVWAKVIYVLREGVRASHVCAVARGGGRGVGDEVADEGEQGLDAGAGDAGVAADDRDAGVQVEGGPHLLGVVAEGAVELVDGDDES